MARAAKLITALVGLCVMMQLVDAWSTQRGRISTNPKINANDRRHEISRKSVLETLAQGSIISAASVFIGQTNSGTAWAAEKLNSGVTYEVVKEGKGAKPEIGELIAIRFAAFCDGRKIDDIFDTPEPYYTRLGSGGLLKGVESTLPNMKLGDRWKLTIPGELAFGPKGRPASAGKPRIPGNAEIVFDVEVVGLPGKEPELIDLIGDD